MPPVPQTFISSSKYKTQEIPTMFYSGFNLLKETRNTTDCYNCCKQQETPLIYIYIYMLLKTSNSSNFLLIVNDGLLEGCDVTKGDEKKHLKDIWKLVCWVNIFHVYCRIYMKLYIEKFHVMYISEYTWNYIFKEFHIMHISEYTQNYILKQISPQYLSHSWLVRYGEGATRGFLGRLFLDLNLNEKTNRLSWME